jgi:predicted lipoprotein
MRKNLLKYGSLAAVLGLVAFNSVYFEKLDAHRAAAGTRAAGRFEATAYAASFWSTKLRPALAQAHDLPMLLTDLQATPQTAFKVQSHALGIGNIRYFLVKGAGTITAVRENDVAVRLTNGAEVRLATEYIFGNAVRDATGLIHITDFENTADLNNVSEQLNTLVRTQVVAPFRAAARPGLAVQFAGAIELNQAHLHLNNLEVIPLAATVMNKPQP